MSGEVFEKVKNIVMDQLNIDESEIKPETSFADDLGADSLDLVELIMALEEEFGFEISDEEAQKIKTVGEVVDYIESRLA